MWLAYHDLSNAWANLHKTSRDCCGQVGDCPRPKKIQNFESETFFILGKKFSVLVPEPYLISACVTTLSALRTVALRHIYLIVVCCGILHPDLWPWAWPRRKDDVFHLGYVHIKIYKFRRIEVKSFLCLHLNMQCLFNRPANARQY